MGTRALTVGAVLAMSSMGVLQAAAGCDASGTVVGDVPDGALADGTFADGALGDKPNDSAADTTVADGAGDSPGDGTLVDTSPGDGGPHVAAFPVKNVVFILKENRSFDNYFGQFPGANGADAGRTCDGGSAPLHPMLDWMSANPGHGWATAHQSFNDGGMNCFDQVTPEPYPGTHDSISFQVADEASIPNYWKLAQTFTLADNFFASTMTSSFSNHLYTLAATSGAVTDIPFFPTPLPDAAPQVGPCLSPTSCPDPGEAGLEPTDITPVLGNGAVWGCDSDPQQRMPVRDPEGHVTDFYPCLDLPTLADSLSRVGVSWRMYADLNQLYGGYFWTAFDAVRHVRDSSDWNTNVVSFDQFLADARNGALPSVSWVSFPLWASEHPSLGSVCTGENWTVAALQALAAGPQWSTTAVFIAWDDWGGFYDHVPPKQIDQFGLGFRVPLIIVSPWAKAGNIDHTLGEFASVLRFIEEDFDLPALTSRDQNTVDMTQDFDWKQTPLALPTLKQRATTPNGDAGCVLSNVPCTPRAKVHPRDVPPYVPVIRERGACTAEQLSNLVIACLPDTPGCATWFAASANAACAQCIRPLDDAGAATNAGGVLTDVKGNFWPNFPGCLAIVDGNANCATAYEALLQCEFVACGDPACTDLSETDPAEFDSCLTTAGQGACLSYYQAMAPCSADFADGGPGVGVCADTYDVEAILCGP